MANPRWIDVAPKGPAGVMWKTVSEDCNLACDYCYYSTCQGKPGKQVRRIADEVLETFIRDFMRLSSGSVGFAWQGGEPLLAGLDFFERVVELQIKHAPPHTSIGNSLQSNGTLITERWAAFFAEYRFLLGVSLDGPADIHDARRKDGAGQGSFERVMRGIGELRRKRVDFNILTVLHKGNVREADRLYDFYRSHGFDWVQFIPCMAFHSQQANEPGVYEITAEEYGDFLCAMFDRWYRDGRPQLSIRFFDNLLSVYMHREAELCVHRKSCAETLILEQNGDAYPCDFYLHPEWKLGNVGKDKLEDVWHADKRQQFAGLKSRLPAGCIGCEWLELCHGGCPRNRSWTAEGGAAGPDYFCRSYKQIYAYSKTRMKALADRLRREAFEQGRRAFFGGREPGRNDACPCGSGRKYKLCCAASG